VAARLAAPLVAQIADRRGRELVAPPAAGLAALSFAVMAQLPWWGVPLPLTLLCRHGSRLRHGGIGLPNCAPGRRLRFGARGTQPARLHAVRHRVH
jgi:hypothetical protein